jgi:hypothetical protein
LCAAGEFVDFVQTAVLVIDRHGNGRAQAAFTAEDLEPFSDMTISIRWALKAGGAIVYTTLCTTVSID